MEYHPIPLQADPVTGQDTRQLPMPNGYAVLIDGLHEGEPILVIRAADAGAMVHVNAYGAEMQSGDMFDEPRRHSFAELQGRMRTWRRAHPELVKDPD